MRSSTLLFLLVIGVAASASADEPAGLGDGPDPDCVAEVHLSLTATLPSLAAPEPAVEPEPAIVPAPSVPRPVPPPVELPRGRDIGRLSASACLGILRAAGIEHVRLPASEAAGIRTPIRVSSAIGGVQIASRDGTQVHEIMDCRLAVALLAWAPALREAGVARAVHYSTYRPGARVGGSGRVSGHARGLAIDLARIDRGEASTDVLTGWASRERGRAPCHGEFDEAAPSARLRRLVCSAVADDLFQVVLTPHYDAAHGNHVHLELVPDVTWSYVH